MHFANSFFGHSAILCAYAGQPERVIPAYLQHGWGEVEPMPDVPYLPGIAKLTWNERNAREARERWGGTATPIGAPFIYLEGGQARPQPEVERKPSTIVYPYHSWDYDADPVIERPGVLRDDGYHDGHRRFAAEIREREEGDVTVTLFWRDHADELVRHAYEEQGFRVICHGDRFDPEFLHRQRAELRRHRRAVTNRLGSAMWYAGHLGLELAAYGPFTGAHPEEARVFHRLQRARWPEMFNGVMNADLAMEAGDEELGRASKREPGELVDIVGWHAWRGRAAAVIELADRIQHRVRWARHQRRLAAVEPFWDRLLDEWGVPRDAARD